MIYFVLHPDSVMDFYALERVSGVSKRLMHREVARLEALGLVQRERHGRTVRYRAIDSHPRWSALRQMVREFTAPEDLLRIVLAHASGVEAAFIFGSCARGDIHAESDIDLFILGDLGEFDMRLDYVGARMEASMLLNREINPVYYTRSRLEARREGGFLTSVLAGPKIRLVGGDTLLGGSKAT